MEKLHSYSSCNLLAHFYVMTMCDYMTSYTRCIMTTFCIPIPTKVSYICFKNIVKLQSNNLPQIRLNV